ncbi:hypothetical protein NP493_1373g00024 [Ridgeia piscesae]|uniref:Phenylalanine ammonia-lyase n=1 Tax=Ridgeia piscesae TaxID=27915 RepID=A0AAD9NCI5_RIDPI|nr:hypothetical protein NP493_1373g00024 [Ridgeia piscesae]
MSWRVAILFVCEQWRHLATVRCEWQSAGWMKSLSRRTLCIKSHAAAAISSLEEYKYKQADDCVVLNGRGLTIATIYAVASRRSTKVAIEPRSVDKMQENVDYLSGKIQDGMVIYGVNTGYGASADVRSDDTVELQNSLIRFLNAGFGPTFPPELVRAVMLVRANSLSLGFSGIRPTTVQLLVSMLNADIIPVVPKRGSVSASGDLMPTSYIAACMMGRPDAKVTADGVETTAPAALEQVRLRPVEFQAKEALAVINAASFASSLGACVLFDANAAILLTQVATALAVESLEGRVESFHPTIGLCVPHAGLQEVSTNLRSLLDGSRLAVQGMKLNQKDEASRLKQDRYCLRSAPQWLAPIVETVQESTRRIETEVNSANDNPLIDHVNDAVIHCANFQGVSSTVAMDQVRQSLQLCGKLIFSQMEEIVNVNLSHGLPPNIAGGDYDVDFGFKGADIAMASYMAELDVLTNPVTNHVIATEMHNQSVNSLGLLSARKSQDAVEVLHMMLANILCCEVQAVDLRWLQRRVEDELAHLLPRYGVDPAVARRHVGPWYRLALQPTTAAGQLWRDLGVTGAEHDEFMADVVGRMEALTARVRSNDCYSDVYQELGQGTRQMYRFLRRTLHIPFHTGEAALDTSLRKIFAAIQRHDMDDVLIDIFKPAVQEESADYTKDIDEKQ